jgi:transcriptional regulator with PAS, ATPase and Fis domain
MPRKPPTVRSGSAALRRFLPTRSAAVREALRIAGKVLDNDATVLMLGESGVGKDYVTEVLHACSARRNGPFVRIDCATLPADLFESELFGFEKGAFTDARNGKVGKLELAQRGTLYLDEVAALAPPLQAKLLRVLQEKSFSRLGGTRTIDLDARIIASSNHDLVPMIDSGAFRRDFYFRLNVVAITLPPLRERREDLAMLGRGLVRDAAKRYGKRARELSPEVLELFADYSWPGNIRELRNIVERAVIVEPGTRVSLESLPHEPFINPAELLPIATRRLLTLEQLEVRYIAAILGTTGDNFTRAADILGISRKTLWEKRRKYRL